MKKFKIPPGADEYTIRLIGLMEKAWNAAGDSGITGTSEFRKAMKHASVCCKARFAAVMRWKFLDKEPDESIAEVDQVVKDAIDKVEELLNLEIGAKAN